MIWVRLGTNSLIALLGVIILIRGLPMGAGLMGLLVGGGLLGLGLFRAQAIWRLRKGQ